MSDYIIRGMAADKQVRFFAANTKDLVEKARRGKRDDRKETDEDGAADPVY